MKKSVIFSLFLFVTLSLFLSNFASAQSEDLKDCEAGDDSCKIDNAYTCLNEQIDLKTCARLSSDEKVFSLLSVGECKSEVTGDSKFQTDLRYTSLALLGGASSNSSESWLVSRNRTTDNLDWFLQIETAEPSVCTVSRGSPAQLSTVQIAADKTLSSSDLSSCFSFSSGNYWLEISPTCFNDEVRITCDKSFLTSLLYQRQDSGTIYVSEETHSASPGGETKEKVVSLCFGNAQGCNYEGSLWATLVLNSLNYDVTPFLPYLVTNIDVGTNANYLPEAFLYALTGQYGNELLSKQKSDKWWQESATNDRFYDSALALYALQYDDSLQRQNSVAWLLEEAQEESGCWNNANVRDTAFLLYSIEPRSSTTGATDSGDDCEDAGNYCMSGISCSQAGGDEIDSLSCSGTFVCCDKPKLVETCLEQGGDVCTSAQRCVGGSVAQASGLSSGEICCISGVCEVPSEPEESACVASGGTCRIGTSCSSGETESSLQCEFSSDICCIQQTGSGISAFWIWLLIVLIVLTGFGILFRERLKHLWFRIKHKFFGGSAAGTTTHSGGPRPPFNPASMLPRRIMPSQPQHHQPASHHQAQKSHGELSDVLKKLKEMGK